VWWRKYGRPEVVRVDMVRARCLPCRKHAGGRTAGLVSVWYRVRSSVLRYMLFIIRSTRSSPRIRYLSRRPLYHTCIFTLDLHRKYNVPSRLTFPTWATSTEAASLTYAHRNPFEHASLPMYSLFQIKAQSKIQLPLWLAFILIYSCVTTPHRGFCVLRQSLFTHPLCWQGLR
jgi:hypothetical protein